MKFNQPELPKMCSIRCTLCKGTAGVPGDRHSRGTCTKLLIHGVSSGLKLQDLCNLGARSTQSMRHCLEFDESTLATTIPKTWVHIVIVDYFAAPIGICNQLCPVFCITGLDEIGDIIQQEACVLYPVLLEKFNKCMTSSQSKRIMILSHRAGRLTFQTLEPAQTNVDSFSGVIENANDESLCVEI